MAALGREDERLDPSTHVLTVLARISERGCQTPLIRSITTKIIDDVYKLNREQVWGVITVKNKCSIMISTISIMTLRYAIVLLQYDLKIMGSNDCPSSETQGQIVGTRESLNGGKMWREEK